MGKSTSRKPKRAAPRCLCCGRIIKSKEAIAAGVGSHCALVLLAARR